MDLAEKGQVFRHGEVESKSDTFEGVKFQAVSKGEIRSSRGLEVFGLQMFFNKGFSTVKRHSPFILATDWVRQERLPVLHLSNRDPSPSGCHTALTPKYVFQPFNHEFICLKSSI